MLRRRRKQKNPLIPTVFGALLEGNGSDYRGFPSTVCPCGCDTFIACVKFDDEERLPVWYLLDGVCAMCGSLVTLPTPIDNEGDE